MVAKLAGPTNEEINAAVQSITNLRAWIKELYEDTGKYEDLAFDALNSTVKTAGWSNFLVNLVINLATGIIDATAIASGEPLVVPAIGFLSAEIKEWINGPNRPAGLGDAFVEYASSHLAMQEAMEQQLAHYMDAKNDHANLRTAWDKTFQVQGTSYKVSDLAKPEHAFPGIGDLWSATKATAAAEFQKRLWNLIIIKTCTFGSLNSEFYTTTATEGSASLNELADYVRQVRYTKNPGVYARRNLTSIGQDGVQYEIYYWTLGLGGNEFPPAVCEMLFRDDTVGNIIRSAALLPRDYVFKQFSPTKPDFRQGTNSNWKEIPIGNNDWDFTGGYFPELTK